MGVTPFAGQVTVAPMSEKRQQCLIQRLVMTRNERFRGRTREHGSLRVLSSERSEKESEGSFSGSVLWNQPLWMVVKDNDSATC